MRRHALDGRARHQEGLQDPLLDQRRPLPGHPLVVESIVAVQRHGAGGALRGIIEDGEEERQDRFSDLSLECVPVLVVVLPLALEPMSDCLMEEDAGGLRLEQSGTGIRIQHRRLPQREQLAHHRVDALRQLFAARKLALFRAVEVAAVLEQHSVRSARPGLHVQGVDHALRHQPRPLAAGELPLLVVHRGAHLRVEQLGVRAEPLGLRPQLASPAGPVEGERDRRIDGHLELLAREARGRLGIVGTVDLLALLLQEGGQRLLVRLVGQEPERVAQRGRIVVERRLAPGGVAGIGALELEHLRRPGVVNLVAADAHVDLQPLVATMPVDEHRPVLGADLLGVDAADGVADEVGRLVPAKLEALVRPLQLIGHGGQLALAGVFRIRREGDRGCEQQGQHGLFLEHISGRVHSQDTVATAFGGRD